MKFFFFSQLSTILFLLSAEKVVSGASFSARDFQIKDADMESMPSLFSPDEAQYDRYAACLAATEGLRKLRDKRLQRRSFAGRNRPTEEQKNIMAEYVVNSSKVLETMGMSVSQFNQLGRQVGDSSQLKEKVSIIRSTKACAEVVQYYTCACTPDSQMW